MSERRKFTPEFNRFVAESALELPVDYLVFRSNSWFQVVIEKHLPWLLSSGYHKAKGLMQRSNPGL